MIENTAASEPAVAEISDEVVLGRLDSYIGFHLCMAQAASSRAERERSGLAKLRPGWFAVLSIIADNPGITPVALSRATGRDKSTLTSILSTLTREEYLESRPRAGDRRSYRLYLTAKGHAYTERIAAHAAEHERELDRIVGERKPEFIRLLQRISEEMG